MESKVRNINEAAGIWLSIDLAGCKHMVQGKPYLT